MRSIVPGLIFVCADLDDALAYAADAPPIMIGMTWLRHWWLRVTIGYWLHRR